MGKTTNVKPSDLNYDKYAAAQYDRDIVNSIPFHQELHAAIQRFIEENYATFDELRILDLGVGTGITSALVRSLLPQAIFHVVDFSEKMMEGAREKLGKDDVRYTVGDYSQMELGMGEYDIVLSVIGLHHQTDEGKRLMFSKISKALKLNGGVFIFGDLMTHRNRYDAALANARHYHHLVQNAADEEALREWAHHHMYLNLLASVEDQEDWLKEAGLYDVQVLFQQFNTVLIVAR